VEARKTTINTDYMFNSCIQPLYLQDDINKAYLWWNMVPGSSR
jgi:hypothetical protein